MHVLAHTCTLAHIHMCTHIHNKCNLNCSCKKRFLLKEVKGLSNDLVDRSLALKKRGGHLHWLPVPDKQAMTSGKPIVCYSAGKEKCETGEPEAVCLTCLLAPSLPLQFS